MADIRISDLNLLGAAPADSDYLMIVQASGPLTKRIYASDLFSYVDTDYIQGKISNPVKPVDTISDLRNVTGDTVITQASVSGYSVVNDGGGGLFHWDGSSTDSDDAGVIIKPTAVSGAGRWVKEVRSRLSVKEFGVTGNGVADDTTKLRAAFNALLTTNAHTLDFDDYVCGVSDDILLTLTKSINVTANGGGIKVLSAIGSYTNLDTPGVLSFVTDGHSFTMKGFHLDGDDKVWTGLHTLNRDGFTGKVILENCLFENVRRELARDGQGNTSLVRIRGGYEHVIAKNNIFRNSIREAGVGVPGSTGTEGLTVVYDAGSTLYYAKSFTHEENIYESIDTEEVGSNRVDCDGLKYFTGETVNADANTKWYQTHFRSTGNRYVDCAGRAMKIQASHGIITGETIVRENVLPIELWTDINLQLGSGIVSNCEFFYSEVGFEGSGVSPFNSSGGTAASGAPISFYVGVPKTGRPLGPITASDCIIYNDVPDTVGKISTFVQTTMGSGTLTVGNQDVEIRNIKMVGGEVESICTATNFTAPTITNFRITGTSAPKITNGLVGLAGSNGDNELRITAIGNSQYSGILLPGLFNTSTLATAFGILSGFDNIGYITNPASYITTEGDSSKSPIAMRLNTIFALQEDGLSAQNGIHLQYKLLTTAAADSAWIVPEMGTAYGANNRSSTYIMTVDRGVAYSSMFTISKTDWIDYVGGTTTGKGATSFVVFDSANGNHNVSGKINVWHDGDNLNILNKAGTSRVNLFAVG